jgi:hypothetical protein
VVVRPGVIFRASLPLLLSLSFWLFGCATGDHARLKSGREFFARGDLVRAETEILSPEVLEIKKSRLQHYLWLASLGMGEESYEKSLFYLDRARGLALELRSDRGGFDWLSSEYKSNPIEYSYLHFFLVVSNLMLAERGGTKAWSIPEVRLKDGTLLIPARAVPARTYSSKEISDFRIRARAELLAWNQFLELLKRTYPGQSFYQDDLLARLLGCFVHGGGSSREERRTGEILGEMAVGILEKSSEYPALEGSKGELLQLAKRLVKRAGHSESTDPEGMVLIESGLLPELKERRIVVGLSTLFERIEDPGLRFQLERIGLQVLLQFAPEFGLVAFTGAVAGAVTSDADHAPKSISGAIDRSFGFEISFPAMDVSSSPSLDSRLLLVSRDGSRLEYPLSSLSPIREIFAHELAVRAEKEWSGKAVKIGLQYLAVLLPAISAYRDAVREGNLFKKLAILAGFFLAKKAIDRANAPDLRSWSILPELISGEMLRVPAGAYSATLLLRGSAGERQVPLGELNLKPKEPFLLHRRVFVSPSGGL